MKISFASARFATRENIDAHLARACENSEVDHERAVRNSDLIVSTA